MKADRDAALEDNLQLQVRVTGLIGAANNWERRWVWAMGAVMVEMLVIVGLVVSLRWPS